MKKILLLCLLILVVGICSIRLVQFYKDRQKNKEIPVSLPEEISLAKAGDRLVVMCVSDSIYLGYSNQLELRTLELVEEGYSRDAAEHIAKVDLHIIPPDNEYSALMED